MKKQVFLLSLISIFLTSCLGQKEVSCENLICTQEFRSIPVKFVDTDGKPVAVTDFKAVNIRTKKVLSQDRDQNFPTTEGVYTVASDANLKDLSVEGDIIMVSAKSTLTQAKEEAEFKIVGGVCSCHVHKVSGPDEIVFD
jgi:hypothetical protein